MPCSQLIALAMLAGVHSAYAHGIAGNRFFPGTLSFDDPAVADEAILPNFASICSARSFVMVRSDVANAKGSVESSGCRTAWDAATFRACARACALVGARPRSMIFRSEITSQYQPPAEPFRETL